MPHNNLDWFLLATCVVWIALLIGLIAKSISVELKQRKDKD